MGGCPYKIEVYEKIKYNCYSMTIKKYLVWLDFVAIKRYEINAQKINRKDDSVH